MKNEILVIKGIRKKKQGFAKLILPKKSGRWRNNQTDSAAAVSTWPRTGAWNGGLKRRSVLEGRTQCDCYFKPSHGNKISRQHMYKCSVFQDVSNLHYCSSGLQETECSVKPAAEKWFQREKEKVTSNHTSFFGRWLWRWPAWQARTLLLLGPDGFVLEPDLRSMLHELLSAGAQSTTRISFGPNPTLQLFVLIWGMVYFETKWARLPLLPKSVPGNGKH